MATDYILIEEFLTWFRISAASGFISWCSLIVLVKGKGIPITDHEGPRGMWMQGSTYAQARH